MWFKKTLIFHNKHLAVVIKMRERFRITKGNVNETLGCMAAQERLLTINQIFFDRIVSLRISEFCGSGQKLFFIELGVSKGHKLSPI